MALYVYPLSPVTVSIGGGLATEATQLDVLAAVGDVLAAVGDVETAVVAQAPLTDAQLRATPVPVSGPLTDTQLRAVAVPVSAASLPLPTGAAEQATLSTLQATVSARLSGSLAPVAYDEIVQTYVGATTDLDTVVYKLATVTVRTLTFSYDGSNRLTGVVAT